MTGTPSAGRRGRHRKPRPRKVLFAAGGLALAAGALSLVHLVPEGGTGAPGTAEAEPRLDPTADATPDRSANTAVSVGTVLRATPSGADVMGGTSATPTTTAAAAPSGSPSSSSTAPPGPATVPTTIPTAPARPTSPPPAPQATGTPASTPGPTSTAGAHQPGVGVCLPIVGLCVDPLAATTPRRGG
ncbi:hypothetical protein [Streptomyces sp. NPDC101234]|uniref:hypothetical protein n=1 Tax=Streptomyces sp. NPDC101234 TaxID=3366138 RepID=UPI0038240A39